MYYFQRDKTRSTGGRAAIVSYVSRIRYAKMPNRITDETRRYRKVSAWVQATLSLADHQTLTRGLHNSFGHLF